MRDVWGNGLNWNESLWRYVTPQRFGEFLDSSCIYFAAATQFEDPFEGAVAVQNIDFPVDPRYAEMGHLERAFFALKRLTKINSWHRATYESDAMWKLYAGASKGVAICSTPARMRDAFEPFRLRPEYGIEDLWAGEVRYEDLLRVRLRVDMLKRFFWKHQAFAWEREFRLAISVRLAEEYGVEVPDNGVSVRVNIDALVERIVLGPLLSGDEQERVMQYVQRAGIQNKLEKSSLLGRPRYV